MTLRLRMRQERQFLDLERTIAKSWRRELSTLDFEDSYKLFREMLEKGQKPKTLEQAKLLVDLIIDSSNQEHVVLALNVLGLVVEAQAGILARWKAVGQPSFRIFAPYTAHVASVDLFFYVAMGSDLISRERPSHKIDFSYLYYLPFCNVFTSGDKLHISIAPLFLGKHQEFIRAADLKADLGNLDKYYSSLPSAILNRGVLTFAKYPPVDQPCLVSRLWDKYLPLWRKHQSESELEPPRDKARDAAIVREMNRFTNNSTPIASETHLAPEDLDCVIIKRLVPIRQGKWKLLPPEVIDASSGLGRPE
jgi:hypothetical protein